MKVTRFLLSVLLLGVTATISSAQGVANLGWQTCAGPVDRTMVQAVGNKAIATVIGQSAPHQAYQVNVVAGSAGGLRDAWRFDAGGCNDGFLTMTHADAAVKTCPGFQGGEGLQIKKWTYDPLTGKTLGIIANAYAQTPALAPNPATRYFLAEWNFDHTFSVVGPSVPADGTCGGLEVGVCIAIQMATWLDMSGNEIPWTIGQSYVTANDPNNSNHCPGPVAVQAKTWGALKSQYRN